MKNKKRNPIKENFQIIFFCCILMLPYCISNQAFADTTMVHEFSGWVNDDGDTPYGGLVLSGSTLYGTTFYGGDFNVSGCVFSIDINGTGFTRLHNFAGGAADGAWPRAGLLLSGSTLYGTTTTGGDNNEGTVFKVDTDGNNFELLHEFNDNVNGDNPEGELIISGTTLYGTTRHGGHSDNFGTIYKIETDGSGFTKLKTYRSADLWTDGANPIGPLVLSGSTLYGTTQSGGGNNSGVLFSVGTDGNDYTVLKAFGASSGPLGCYGVILSGNVLYGSCYLGGTGNVGGIFSYNLGTSTYTVLKNFTDNDDGDSSWGRLMIDGTTLYGMTYYGGSDNEGVVFSIETNGSNYTVMHEFDGSASDGGRPQNNSNLILSNDLFYGMTTDGGDEDKGVIFSLPLNSAPILGHTANNVLGTVTQDTDGTGNVNIPFRIQDADTNDCTTLGWQYSDDGGSGWNDLVAGDMTGEDGSKASAVDWTGAEHTIVWTSKNQIDDSHQSDIQFRFKVNDGSDDSADYGTSASFTADNLDPTLSSIAWTDVDSSTDISATDTLLFTFSEDMKTSTVTQANIDTTLPLAGTGTTYGTSPTVDWGTPAGDDTLTVTLDSGVDIVSGDTVNPAAAATDAFGNADGTGTGVAVTDDVSPTLDSISWDDVDSSGSLSQTDTLTFTFSEAMDTSSVDNEGGANDVDIVLAPSDGNYGSSGASSISWTSSSALVVTLGASPTIAMGATVNPTAAVGDATGNGDNTTSNGGAGPSFVDPFGVVFDSVSNNPIQGAVVTIYDSADVILTPGVAGAGGCQINAADSNPQTTGATGQYSFLTAVANGYTITVTADGYTYPSAKSSFPAGRTIVTGSKGESFDMLGAIIEMDHPMDSGGSLLTIEKDANKKEVTVGDIVTYTVTLQNSAAGSVVSVYLEDKIPGGFKYISGKATVNGVAIADPTGSRTLTFDIGSVSANSTSTLKYQLVVGSGVTFGNYENTAFAKYSDGTTISNTASETVKVVPDPLFDLGTVIGKVFNDKNESGIQDSPQSVGGQVIVEEAIPNMQIVTENGAVITTDKHGKYHLAGIIPGRHLFRLDERALPQGAYLTTEKVVIVDITPGILAKVNFGIKLPEGVDLRKIPFQISQDRGIPKPRLNASLLNDELIIKDKQLKERAEFRIFTNYHLFIKKWRLDILDQDTKRIVKTLKGSKDNIFKPIYWNGKDKRNKLITTDKNYSYRLTVTGAKGKKDITNERSIKVIGQKLEAVSIEGDKTDEEKQEEYQEWINQQNKRNDIEKQAIPIKGETIRITNSSLPVANIKIIKEGKIKGQVPLVQQESLTAGEFLEGPQSQDEDQSEPIDIIFPQGEYDIEAIPSQSETTAGSKSVYTKSIKVGENYLFFVAMGDAKMGYTFHRGDIEPIQHDDKFREGFWSEGKGSYYLKGKIKGKYLITSSFDSERDQKELFKNLDPDKYYPVYGDESSINYNATNTQGMLYLLIEWDKSKAIWGNYNTALTDTEFTNFSRTLYGGKVHLESVSTTKFGQPDIKLIAFRARAQQKAAHNEFTGTGGSLFYLKHKDVIEGSDKVVIEIRDKITGLVLGSEEMREGADYETDYSNGRIIFWKTVRFITESSSIISSQLLDGNPVYVVVDYEYETKDKYDEGTVGARVQKSLTDYIDLGATYVKEELQKENYELKGTDATIHLGKDIKLTAEYAESKSEAMGSFISTDGGLSFTELPTGEYSKGKAYGLKGQAYLFDHKLNLSSYYKWIDNDFSTSATSSQQGKELIGIGATYDLSQKTRLTVSHDIQKLIDDGNAQTQLQVGATKTKTTSAQVTHDLDRLKLTGEYRHQEIKERKEEFESEVNREEDTLAVRADYELTKKVDVSLEQQATLKGTANNQTSVGIVARVFDWLSLRAKEIIGNEGTATSVGATSSVKDKLDISADYTLANHKTDGASNTASLSAISQIDDKTKAHVTYAVSDSMSESRTSSIVYGVKKKLTNSLELSADRSFVSNSSESTHSNIFGLSGDINDQWAARASFERGIIQNHDGTQDKRNAGSLGLGFVDKNKETGETKLKASSKIELRFDEGQEDKRQYLLCNTVEKNVNPDTTLFAKANFSQTKNTDADSTESQFKELVFGSAYRPVDIDWLNLLAKYTYLEDSSPSSQSDINDTEKEKAHVFAAEGVIDLSDKWQLSEKIAYKISEEKVTGFDFTKTSTWLLINRLGYNIDEEWQIAGEYRLLTQKQADDQKHGALIELSRNIGEFIQIGVGYNFTDFNDDLTRLDYTAHGPFFRITGKFYDRTPEEIERVKQKQKERKEELARKREEKERDRRLRIEKRNKKRLLKKKISDINKEAKKLYREKLYAESTFKFKEVLELDLKNKTALKYLQHISQKMKMEGKTKQKNIVF